jgi:hypothetical protein
MSSALAAKLIKDDNRRSKSGSPRITPQPDGGAASRILAPGGTESSGLNTNTAAEAMKRKAEEEAGDGDGHGNENGSGSEGGKRAKLEDPVNSLTEQEGQATSVKGLDSTAEDGTGEEANLRPYRKADQPGQP